MPAYGAGDEVDGPADGRLDAKIQYRAGVQAGRAAHAFEPVRHIRLAACEALHVHVDGKTVPAALTEGLVFPVGHPAVAGDHILGGVLADGAEDVRQSLLDAFKVHRVRPLRCPHCNGSGARPQYDGARSDRRSIRLRNGLVRGGRAGYTRARAIRRTAIRSSLTNVCT